MYLSYQLRGGWVERRSRIGALTHPLGRKGKGEKDGFFFAGKAGKSNITLVEVGEEDQESYAYKEHPPAK